MEIPKGWLLQGYVSKDRIPPLTTMPSQTHHSRFSQALTVGETAPAEAVPTLLGGNSSHVGILCLRDFVSASPWPGICFPRTLIAHSLNFSKSLLKCHNLLKPFLINLFKIFSPLHYFLLTTLSCFISLHSTYLCPPWLYPRLCSTSTLQASQPFFVQRKADQMDSISKLLCPAASYWIWPIRGSRRRSEGGKERGLGFIFPDPFLPSLVVWLPSYNKDHSSCRVVLSI